MSIRSKKTKDNFIKYLKEHPSERFWQSLLNWSGLPYILWSSTPDGKNKVGDTFYWEGKGKDED